MYKKAGSFHISTRWSNEKFGDYDGKENCKKKTNWLRSEGEARGYEQWEKRAY